MFRRDNRFIDENIVYEGDIVVLRNTQMYIDGKGKNVAEECNIKVAYLCDRRACTSCNAECGYTTNIEHAKNFKREGTILIDG